MRVGFLNGVALAGLVLLSGAAGVLVVKMTSPLRPMQFMAPAPERIFATPGPAAAPWPATTTASNGGQQFARSCAGAFAEAKSVGVVPGFANLDAASRPGASGQTACTATTASSRYEVAYFASCKGGRDTCPVLARVTQDAQFILFHRD